MHTQPCLPTSLSPGPGSVVALRSQATKEERAKQEDAVKDGRAKVAALRPEAVLKKANVVLPAAAPVRGNTERRAPALGEGEGTRGSAVSGQSTT